VRVVLVSTYELGHQPLHLAVPAAALLAVGHDVECVDLSVGPLDAAALERAEVVAVSVPMHTAMRMARPLLAGIRARHPHVRTCLYGLYAGLDGAQGAAPVADAAFAGEYLAPLVSWVGAREPAHGAPRAATTPVHLARRAGPTPLPARHLLPPLERYARLAVAGEERLAGYVEASRGCVHRCRHCPVPVVYDGRTRIDPVEALVADVEQLVGAGARHVTFGDPDFLNGPHHARRVLSAVHGAFPQLTFDVTVKVEHVLAHRGRWRDMAASGVVFVVSAFESADDEILRLLDKGHSAADEAEAVTVLRAAGIEPRPSWLPFTPWTRPEHVQALLDVVERCDLVGNVDPVQYAIRLLVPPGSLLLSSGALAGRLGDYDDERLGWSWRSPDTRLDSLADELAALAEQATAQAWDTARAFDAVRACTDDALGRGGRASPLAPLLTATSALAPDERPRLTEPWFCCAEPTAAQLAISDIRSATADPATDTRCPVP
jgi:Radical SAM superfamily